jgi:hypothetical protein
VARRARGAIDECFLERVVRDLRRANFPASEGYYLVVLSPLEADELVYRLLSRRVTPLRRYAHPPMALVETIRSLRYEYRCTVGEAVVCAADHGALARRAEFGRLRLV